MKKPKGSDIKWSNSYGDQTTNFISYTKSPNTKNSCYNHKKIGTTSNARPTICVSSTSQGKTQVGWANVVKQKTQKLTKTNNTPHNGSPCNVPHSNKMIMKLPC
jgi:hypothetical protein